MLTNVQLCCGAASGQWVYTVGCVCMCVCARAGGWEIILGPLEKRNKADSGPFLQVCFSWQRKVGEMLYFLILSSMLV